MSVKEENEITVRALCSAEVLAEQLKARGFREGRCFSMEDAYFIPELPELSRMTSREILAKAVLIRLITEGDRVTRKITFKEKQFTDSGDILSQRAVSCGIRDIAEAKALFSALGYREIMILREDDRVFRRGDAELALKQLRSGCTLMEFETDEHYPTVEALKTFLDSLELDIEKGNYFVKKAELALDRVLNRGE